jgi:hypothetical protein
MDNCIYRKIFAVSSCHDVIWLFLVCQILMGEGDVIEFVGATGRSPLRDF